MKRALCLMPFMTAAILVLAGCGEDRNGLGTICSSSLDCPDGLACGAQPTETLDDDQCNIRCDSSEDCTSRFGSDTFCSGLFICVVACDTDSDCPEGTSCLGTWCKADTAGL
jgi:hypothetical protein